MKKIILFLIVGFIALLSSSCQGPTHGVRTNKEPLESHYNLIYMDQTLTSQVPCETLDARKLESGRMTIYARFFNKRNKAAECQIQVKFKGGDGRIVDQTGWMPFLLPRREVTEFRHTSLANNVSDFTLLLREAR